MRPIFNSILLFTALVLGVATAPAMAQVIEGVACIEEQPAYTKGTLGCTANDIQLSSPLVTVVKPCSFPGDTATLQVLFDLTTTATNRNDIAVWFSVDGDPNGDGPATGVDANSCTVAGLPSDLLLNTDIVPTIQTNYDTDFDGDLCGDASTSGENNDNEATVLVPQIIDVDLGTFDLLCNDSDNDGLLDVPVIVSWKSQSNNDCTSPLQSVPTTSSKCSFDNSLQIDVPIPGRIIVDKVTDPVDATVFDFNISGDSLNPVPAGGFDGDEDFQLADATTPFDTASFNGGLTAPGSYSITETANAAYASVGVCSSDIDGTNTDPANISLRTGETVNCVFTNSLVNPDLSTLKELTANADEDASGSITEGDTLTYEITVTNTGNVSLNNVVVTDTLITPTGGTTPCATLNVAETCTLIGTYVVTGGDVEAGSITNTGTGDSDETDPVDDELIIQVESDPALDTVKSLTSNADEDASGTVSLGDTLSFAVTVTNTGNITLNNVVVTDSLITPTGGTTPCTTVAVGATCTLTGTYMVTQGDVDTGSITNTGTGDSDETGPDDDTVVTSIDQNPGLGVAKALTSNADEDSSGTVSVGDTLTYTVTATNTGNITLNNVVVTDTLVTPTGGTTPCASVAPGATCTLVGTYTVTQADVDEGVIVNTGTGDSDETDPVNDRLNTPVPQSPALTTEKELTSNADEDSSGTVSVGDTLTYTVTVTNTGNTTLNNVVVTDTLVTPTGGTTPCATVAPGATCTLVGTYTVTQADVDEGVIVNTGTGDSDETDPVNDQLNTPVPQAPALTTEKELTSNADEDSSGSVSLGDTLTYTITVTNTGNVTLTDVVVSDNKITPTGGTTPCATLALGATCTLVGTYKITLADVNAGSVTNTGTGDSNETDAVDDTVVTPVVRIIKPIEDVPVPALNQLMLILLSLMMLSVGLYVHRARSD